MVIPQNMPVLIGFKPSPYEKPPMHRMLYLLLVNSCSPGGRRWPKEKGQDASRQRGLGEVINSWGSFEEFADITYIWWLVILIVVSCCINLRKDGNLMKSYNYNLVLRWYLKQGPVPAKRHLRWLDVAELHVALVGKEQLVHNKYSSRHSWKLNTLVLHPRFQPGMASIAPLTGHSGHDIWSKAFFKA
jgi:hypothetical protein